jgi:hypothetical protein
VRDNNKKKRGKPVSPKKRRGLIVKGKIGKE